MNAEVPDLVSLLEGRSNPKPVEVPAPEIGEGAVIYVRGLSLQASLRLGELDAAAAGKGEAEQSKQRRAAMLEVFGAAVCAADGTPLFPAELTDGDRVKIGRVPMSLVARVAGAVNREMVDEADAAKKG